VRIHDVDPDTRIFYIGDPDEHFDMNQIPFPIWYSDSIFKSKQTMRLFPTSFPLEAMNYMSA